MPAKDVFHDVVKKALMKQGWTITDDPLIFRTGGVNLYIDLGAEKILAAEKNGNKIAVEIKSFVGKSYLSEFHQALGQFINYRMVLKEEEPERVLYLAISSEVYKDFFILPFTQNAIKTNQVKLIVYEINQEDIIKWLT